MPLRNALRAPRRTLLTVLGIGAVLSVLVAFMGMIDSFEATVDRSEAEVAHGNPIASSSHSTASTAPARRRAVVATAPGVADAESQLPCRRRSRRPGPRLPGSVTLLDFKSPIWAPTIASARRPCPAAPKS